MNLVGLADEPALEFMRVDETALEFKRPGNLLGYVAQVVSRKFFPVKIDIQIDQF
jgi:hypothetical protein